MRKPHMTLDLIAPEGNAYALVGKAQSTLIAAGLNERADELGTQFEELAANPKTTYLQMRALVEEFCTVTWFNEHARLKEAIVTTQENATELADTLESLRIDLDKRRKPIKAAKALEAIRDLRSTLETLEQRLNTLQESTP